MVQDMLVSGHKTKPSRQCHCPQLQSYWACSGCGAWRATLGGPGLLDTCPGLRLLNRIVPLSSAFQLLGRQGICQGRVGLRAGMAGRWDLGHRTQRAWLERRLEGHGPDFGDNLEWGSFVFHISC